MSRPPLRSLLPALLVGASVLTAVPVGLGVLAHAGDPAGGVTPVAATTQVGSQVGSQVVAADAGARASTGTVSRNLARGGTVAPGSTGATTSSSAAGAPVAPQRKVRATPLQRLAPYEVVEAGDPIAKLPPGPVPGDPFTFQIGTLNILGSQHARNGTGRAAMLAGAITGRGVDLVGLQEVQSDQLAVLQGRLPGYSVFPGQAMGRSALRLQIAYRADLFEVTDYGSITTTFDHQRRPIPWIRLRDKATTAEFYVVNIHNSPRDQEADRDAATTAEISLVNSLRATGKPVFILGDTNEHEEFACRVMAATGSVASSGGSASGGCSLGARPVKIDWILGGGGVAFSGHVVDYGAPIRTATDHAFVHATVTVTPMVTPAG